MKINWTSVVEYAIAIVIGMAVYNLIDRLFLENLTEKIVAKFEE